MSLSRKKPPRRKRAGGAALLSLLLMVLAVLGGAGRAAAESPFRLPTQVTDRNNTIGCTDDAVNHALASLRSRDGISLWVVFTDSFSGLDGKTWANQTAGQSGFGPTPSCWQ